ncbi:hypothetical protein V9I37_004473 [Salmonella enterica]|nr:hypothetical protein [Salmonella enterica]ECE5060679.1 hypothetical protein [Salmonella enterica]EHY8370854.1 hypothetical protein [Salmonella enterica]EHZ1020832.1 hypothetical protein [Salmonella enterica]EIE4991622.1 hypothetical protein [Salmonella enterica]
MKMNKFALITILLIATSTEAAQRSELEKIYSKQTPGSQIQCQMKQKTLLTDSDMVVQLKVTGISGNKTLMEARVITTTSGMGERLSLLATFNTTRTMLADRDLWEPDMNTFMVTSTDKAIKKSSLEQFEREIREKVAFTYDMHSDIYITTYPNYEIGKASSGLFSSETAMSCQTRFAKD